jgi:hypothetical protein
MQCLPQSNQIFKSFTDTVSKTFRVEGMRGFYKGMLAPMILNNLTVFHSILSLQLLNKFQSLGTNKPTLVAMNALLVGSLSIFITPMDLIKIRLQINTDPTRQTIGRQGFLDCVKHTIRQPGGIANLYHGEIIHEKCLYF